MKKESVMRPKEFVVIIVMALIAILVLILAIFYFKHRKIVIANSALYKKIQIINRKYLFDYSLKPVLFFSQVCKSKRGLDSFDFVKNLKKIIADNLSYYQHLIDKLRNNSKLWVAYKDEYKSIESYSTKENIKDIKLSLKIFNWHEKLLYKSSILKRPITNISVKYVATYTSPAGKNSYRLNRDFSHYQFESLLNEIVNQIKEKKQRRIEREELYSKVRKEKNMQKRESKLAEKEALYGSIESRERALERREDRLAEKEATYGSIESRERHLTKREENLSQREKEFSVATRGHIYAVLDSPAPVEVVHPKIETAEESLSAWEKMKRLKKAYENGEITYEEYNEKRKHLL